MVEQPSNQSVPQNSSDNQHDSQVPGTFGVLAEQQQAVVSQDSAITWTASEYVNHHKNFGWYASLFIIAGVAAALIYLVTKDMVSAVVVVVAAVVFGVYAARPPKVQHYAIDDHGVGIGPKLYAYNELKSFSVIDEGPFASITFMPMKRFMPALSIYYDPQDEEKIINALSQHLPMEQRDHDLVEKLMRKIRF